MVPTLAARVCAAGPVGILTLPPAPTVDHPLAVAAAAGEGEIPGGLDDLLARSAYRLPRAAAETAVVCTAAAAAAMAFCLRTSSSRWMSASVFLEEAVVWTLAATPLEAAGCFHALPAAVLTGEPVPQVLVAGSPRTETTAFSR